MKTLFTLLTSLAFALPCWSAVSTLITGNMIQTNSVTGTNFVQTVIQREGTAGTGTNGLVRAITFDNMWNSWLSNLVASIIPAPGTNALIYTHDTNQFTESGSGSVTGVVIKAGALVTNLTLAGTTVNLMPNFEMTVNDGLVMWVGSESYIGKATNITIGDLLAFLGGVSTGSVYTAEEFTNAVSNLVVMISGAGDTNYIANNSGVGTNTTIIGTLEVTNITGGTTGRVFISVTSPQVGINRFPTSTYGLDVLGTIHGTGPIDTTGGGMTASGDVTAGGSLFSINAELRNFAGNVLTLRTKNTTNAIDILFGGGSSPGTGNLAHAKIYFTGDGTAAGTNRYMHVGDGGRVGTNVVFDITTPSNNFPVASKFVLPLTIAAPTVDLHAATKKYVDDAVAGVGGGSQYPVVTVTDAGQNYDLANTNQLAVAVTSDGPTTYTLPASPSDGVKVMAVNHDGVNTLEILRNGKTIRTLTNSLVLSQKSESYLLHYCAASNDWQIISHYDPTALSSNQVVDLIAAGGGGCGTYSILTNLLAADGSNIWINAGPMTNVAGLHGSITLTNNFILNGPTNASFDGQIILLRCIQDAVGYHTLSTNGTAAAYFKFGTDITTGFTVSAGAVDYISLVWYAASNQWHPVSFIRGY
jgi:hypothetical protein